jgi:glycosyltransferase involved in cell wall biosynthesis
VPDEIVLRERGTGRELRVGLTSSGSGAGVTGAVDLRNLLDVPQPAVWEAGAAHDHSARSGGWAIASELDPVLTPSAFVPAEDGVDRVRPHTTRAGQLGVAVDRALPHAEYRRVLVEEDALVVMAYLPLSGAVGPCSLVAGSRERDREVAAPAVIDGRLVLARLPFAALDTDVPGTEYWDLSVRTGEGGTLRVAGYLDGVANKKKAIVFPTRSLVLPSGSRSMQPYFTVNNGLSLRSKPPQPPPSTTTTAAPSPRQSARDPRVTRLQRVANHLIRAAALRLARTVVRRLPARRAIAPVRRGRPHVAILVMHGYGMGGTVRTVFNLAAYLSREHEVEIVSQVRERKEPFFDLPPGVALSPLDDRTEEGRTTGVLRFVRARLERLPSLLIPEADNTFARSTLWTDVQLVRRFRAQRGGIVITTRPSLNFLAGELAAADVITVGQSHLEYAGHNPALLRDLPRSYRLLDALAVLTEGDLDDWSRALTPSRTRVVRIPNILTPLTGGLADPGSRVVVAAGRLTGPKGFHLLIRAFEQVVRDHPDWSLRIYGSGAQARRLRQMVLDRGLYNNVLLMGRADRMGDELAKGSIFALSSRSEGFGMVIIEAMSKGLAVVSFDCPRGPREIIHHGHDGLLVPNGDVDALAAALKRLIEDEDERRRLGAAGLRTATRYGPEPVGRSWDELFARLLAERAPSWWR